MLKESLEQARQLVIKGWCQGNSAENAKGESCDELSPDAVAFCATGAVSRVAYDTQRIDDEPILVDILQDAVCSPVNLDFIQTEEWNDAPERTVEEVLDVFDDAIARADRIETPGVFALTRYILRHAQDYIRQGWAQGQHPEPEGTYGTTMALFEAAQDAFSEPGQADWDDDINKALAMAFTAIEEHRRRIAPNIKTGQWESAPGRTQEEVLTLFDSAIFYLPKTFKKNQWKGGQDG